MKEGRLKITVQAGFGDKIPLVIDPKTEEITRAAADLFNSRYEYYVKILGEEQRIEALKYAGVSIALDSLKAQGKLNSLNSELEGLNASLQEFINENINS